MKILLVHNEYGKRSGEEAVVDTMATIFTSLGHDVARLTMTTAGARESLSGKIKAFAAGINCPSGVRAMREAIDRERPDVVNVHNLYPFISPAGLRECQRAGVPVIMTVHNFRLMCPTGLFMRDGAPCELCLEHGHEWECVRHNCEGSMPKSLAYAARNAVARLRRHYLDCVDTFACITDFQRIKLRQAGFPDEKLALIPNSVTLPEGPAERMPASDGRSVNFVGRLSREKGIDLIIEAARRCPDIPFRLAGAVANPALVADLPSNVELTGFLSGADLDAFFDSARFMVMASRCYEGFPMSILEAAARSRAVVAPDHGGFTEIIGREGEQNIGLLFTPGDADDLTRNIRALWDNPEQCTELGRAARSKLERCYSQTVIAGKWAELLESLK